MRDPKSRLVERVLNQRRRAALYRSERYVVQVYFNDVTVWRAHEGNQVARCGTAGFAGWLWHERGDGNQTVPVNLAEIVCMAHSLPVDEFVATLEIMYLQATGDEP